MLALQGVENAKVVCSFIHIRVLRGVSLFSHPETLGMVCIFFRSNIIECRHPHGMGCLKTLRREVWQRAWGYSKGR